MDNLTHREEVNLYEAIQKYAVLQQSVTNKKRQNFHSAF